jgi:hypothetical protein
MMDLVEKTETAPTVAASFHKMGDLMTKNAAEKFGGAFVIVDPTGETLESLFINDATPGLFWGTLKTIVDQQIIMIDDKERKLRSGFGR